MTTLETTRDDAAAAKALVRGAATASLATRLADDGAPYASLVLAATDAAGRPLLFLSDLADHTRNIAADPRVSLLFDGTGGRQDRLAGPRVSVQGNAAAVDAEAPKARFLRRHPTAEVYAGFADFRLYRVSVTRAHLVAGFGRIAWLDGADLIYAGDADGLAAAEAEIVAHMNADHADALRLIATQLLQLPDAGWRMAGTDPEGADLIAGGRLARIPYDKPVETAEQCRAELVRLTKRARRAAGTEER